MYSHREEKNQVDVVDLDPYGTAAPFIDAAIQSVNNGGKVFHVHLALHVYQGNLIVQVCYALPVQICLSWQLRITQRNGKWVLSRYRRPN